jgi:glycerol-3-phosphate cytidylyltransferase
MSRVGYAPGAYDLFHVGHLNLLRQARAHCDRLVAGVVTDDVLEITKGRRPVIPLAERLEIVRHIDVVDDVFVETQPDKLLTWRECPFDVIFKGDDWRDTPKGLQLEQDFAAVGVEIVYFPYTVHTSSTVLRKALSLLEAADGAGPASVTQRH